MLTILKLLKSDRDVELSISNGVTPRWNSKNKKVERTLEPQSWKTTK